jgi:NADPH2:quinone reductase
VKAIRVQQFGGPEVLKLEDVPDPPAPGPGQVVVRVRAAGINPADTYVRAGAYASLPPLPFTPGSDGAGTIEKIGDGVTNVEPGDRVWVFTQMPTSGTYAEKLLCPADKVYPLPDRLSFAQGAAIGVPYVTAWRALFLQARAMPGDTALIHGASGGVGIAAVQLARAAGLTVIGTAGSERGLALVHKQGAHHVFDHKLDSYRDEILLATHKRGVDVVIEMAAHVNLNADLTLLANHGRIAIVGSRGNLDFTPRGIMAKDAIITGGTLWTISPNDSKTATAALDAGFENGTLTPVIGLEVPITDAPRAHEAVSGSGTYGKVVLMVP